MIYIAVTETHHSLPYTLRSPVGYSYNQFGLILKATGVEFREIVDRTKRHLSYHLSPRFWYTELNDGVVLVSNFPGDADHSTYIEKGEVVKDLTRQGLFGSCLRIQKYNDCRNCPAHRNLPGCVSIVYPSIPHIPFFTQRENLTDIARTIAANHGFQFVASGVLGSFGRPPTIWQLTRMDWEERIEARRKAPSKIQPSIVARRICEQLCVFRRSCLAYDYPYGAVRCQNGEDRGWAYGSTVNGYGPFTDEMVKKAYAEHFNRLDGKRSVEEITFIAANSGHTTNLLGQELTLRKMCPNLSCVQFMTKRGSIYQYQYEDAMRLISLPQRSYGQWFKPDLVRPKEPMTADQLLVYMGLCDLDGWEIKTGYGWGSTKKAIGKALFRPGYDRAFYVTASPTYWHTYTIDDIPGIIRMCGYWHPAQESILNQNRHLLVRAAKVKEVMDSMKGTPLSQLRKRK